MWDIFEDKDKKKGNDVTDELTMKVSQLLELVAVIVEHIKGL